MLCQVHDACYRIIEMELTAAEATRVCTEHGAETAFFSKADLDEDDSFDTITKWLNVQAEQIRITPRQVWIGLHEVEIVSSIPVDHKPQEFVYTRLDANHTAAYTFLADYTNWDWNQPQRPRNEHPTVSTGTLHEEPGCVYVNLNTGRWSVGQCEMVLPVLCRGSLTTQIQSTTTTNRTDLDRGYDEQINIDKCGSPDWMPWFDELTNATYCYTMANVEVDHDDAKLACVDSYLVTIHSSYEQAFIAHEIRDSTKAVNNWIGVELNLNQQRLNDHNITDLTSLAIGSTYSIYESDALYFFDAVEQRHGTDSSEMTTPIIYAHWAKEADFRTFDTSHCITMGKYGWWSYRACDEKLRPICKKLAIGETAEKEDAIPDLATMGDFENFDIDDFINEFQPIAKCPTNYTPIVDKDSHDVKKCVRVFSMSTVNDSSPDGYIKHDWDEAQRLCQVNSIDGFSVNLLTMNSFADVEDVYEALYTQNLLTHADNQFWIGVHFIPNEETGDKQWTWANGLPVLPPINAEKSDESNGCVRVLFNTGDPNQASKFEANQVVKFDRTRCASHENFICSVDPMRGTALDTFSNNTMNLDNIIRKTSDFIIDCTKEQLANIDVSNKGGEFFQFGGSFNGRKTCYYLR